MAFTEDYLKAQIRQQGYLDIMMFIPDKRCAISNITTNDKSEYSNISYLSDIQSFNTDTIATLEENLWLLNGNFKTITDGTTIKGYMSNSCSDANGDFTTNPSITFNFSYTNRDDEQKPTFSILLNPNVPTAYPKQIILRTYNNDTLINTYTQNLEWDETTEELDEDTGEPIVIHHVLDTLPTVAFSDVDVTTTAITKMQIEFVGTKRADRRIRVSGMTFGRIMLINPNDIVSADFTDKASYVSDTLPTRTFKFELNNYAHLYDVDNPDNDIVDLDSNTVVMFRCGYNVYGYEKDEQGHLVFDEEGYPIINNPGNLQEIEWNDWVRMRLINVSATSGESAVFECGSDFDLLNTVFDEDNFSGYTGGSGIIMLGVVNTILQTIDTVDINIEWSSDGIKVPTYFGGLLPYEQWRDTEYMLYHTKAIIPAAPIKQILQYIAFSIGSTLLIKDNGAIKFACLNIDKSESFTNHFDWTYRDFEEIPEPEQLESIQSMEDISLLKYITYRGEDVSLVTDALVSENGDTYISFSQEGYVTSSGGTADSGATGYIDMVWSCNRRCKYHATGLTPGYPWKARVRGYALNTQVFDTKASANAKIILDTKLMCEDMPSYNKDGSIKEPETIKRKYLDWYKQKFKYKIKTRGEPLTRAGDYCTIQTQFAEEIPGYILQNHWTFNGTWSGDMEVISLE